MKQLILFENPKIMGHLPYKNYNCSILKLNTREVSNITDNIYNQEALLIIFYVSSPRKRYGTMSWVGIICFEKLRLLLNKEKYNEEDDFWMVKPHLLQNDLGPKYADLRIFKLKNKIGVIGYTRVAKLSNTLNIADYYVRASILNTRNNDSLYDRSKSIFNFNETDGGCFPSKIGNNYKKFEINKKSRFEINQEFYIEDNKYSKEIYPHRSKDILMPSCMKLNGIEVSFSKSNSNEFSQTHISTKNIIPLQHLLYLDNIGCFVDTSPPNSNESLITIQDLLSGQVYHTDRIITDNQYQCKNYKGSTPFIELYTNIWITILHKRSIDNNYTHSLSYDYYFVFYSSKNININSLDISIPKECVYEIKLDNKIFIKNEFIYITGLIVDKIVIKNDWVYLDILISYGISDQKSGISNLELKIPNKLINLKY